MTSIDEIFMSRCVQLARCAMGGTSPNPAVGAVIVCDGRIIGEGYHIKAGEPHAEVNAVRSVKEADRRLLPQSTIYVTLEPCSHYGKTPPCCDLIIECGIRRVVIGVTDSNKRVNGSGISRMRDAGIEVVVGVLQEQSLRLNRPFFTYHERQRPFVTLKWAETADGFIGTGVEGAPLKISTPVSQVAVHKLRAMHDAILVGTRTALLDNPSLNVRLWAGRSPLRLVIDRFGTLPAGLNLFDGTAPTIVYTSNAVNGKFGKNIKQVELDFSENVIPQILSHLYSLRVNSLLVEGGVCLLRSFIESALWDRARVERNPSMLAGGGVAAPVVPESLLSEKTVCGGNEIALYAK